MLKLLKVTDVASHLSVSRSTVYEYIDKGILQAVRLPSITSARNSIIRVRFEDLELFLHNYVERPQHGR